MAGDGGADVGRFPYPNVGKRSMAGDFLVLGGSDVGRFPYPKNAHLCCHRGKKESS